MRIARCQTGNGIQYGVVDGENIHLLAGGLFDAIEVISTVHREDITLLAPCMPGKIAAFGINYAPHAAEIDFEIPKEPLLFLKPSTSIIGPDDAIRLPAMSQQVEYEGELAVVIGRPTKNVAVDDALDAVLGYTCINDVTARDLQKRDVQFTRSKSFDTFAPIGPWIETELDPADLVIETFLNSEKRQSANTGSMIRSVPELVSFVSQVMTLLPGDIIATGTPAGVAPMKPGDVVSVSINKIGTLTNRVEKYDYH